jgi:hypothetical protein
LTLAGVAGHWHDPTMPVPPWVIDEIENERARRDEEERSRRHRIELPQSPRDDEGRRPTPETARAPAGGVVVVDISPRPDNCIDL